MTAGPKVVREHNVRTLVGALAWRVARCAKLVAGTHGDRLYCVPKQPYYVNEHELQRIMPNSPEPVAIASAANARVEGVHIMISATMRGTTPDVSSWRSQQFRQLETKPKGERELVVPSARCGVHRDGEDAQPRARMKSSCRQHSRTVAGVWL